MCASQETDELAESVTICPTSICMGDACCSTDTEHMLLECIYKLCNHAIAECVFCNNCSALGTTLQGI